MKDNANRLHRYVTRYHKRIVWAFAPWPTVRECARALRLKQGDVEELADDYPWLFMLTSLNTTPPATLGDHYVELAQGPTDAVLRMDDGDFTNTED
jgi:hypothetical protein